MSDVSAFDKIAAAYLAHPKEEPLLSYVEFHLRHGFVFSRPDFFTMGRPVLKAAGDAAILDPMHLFPSEDCDCWYIHAAAGNTARMWQVVPWDLPWFCWTRLSDPLSGLQYVSAERLKRLCPPDLSRIR